MMGRWVVLALVLVTLAASPAHVSAAPYLDLSQPAATDFQFIFLADIHIGDAEAAKVDAYIRASVHKINSMVHSHGLKFVLIAGDLTTHGEPQEYHRVHEILEELSIPYFPVLGNHDTWDYGDDYEEKNPTSDMLFVKTFGHRFKGVHFDAKSVHNPEHAGIPSVFPNWVLPYGDLVIYGLDWNSRKHAVTQLHYKGAWPGCELHDFPGGTFHWLDTNLAALASEERASDKQIVFVQHHPYRAPRFVPDKIYGCSHSQKAKLRDLYAKHFKPSQYFGLLAGHFHRWFDGTAFDEKEWAHFRQWEVEASKVSSAFTLVTVTGGKISKLEKMYGNAK